jgi:hypothetical protein
MEDAHNLVRKRPHLLAYGKINLSTSIFAEQTENMPNKVQSGTFPIIYELLNADRSNPERFDGDPTISPSSAFRSAGSSKSPDPDEVDDYNHQRDRELEIEAEKTKQQRIRDSGLCVRTKGNARRGEIDGTSSFT